MGEKRVDEGDLAGARSREFMGHLLRDIQALDWMIDAGRFESGVRRIGAEQEVFLVDEGGRPAMRALELLHALDDPHFAPELGLFNLEINLDPCPYDGGCLRSLEAQLADLLGRLEAAAAERGMDVVLTGILPTLRKPDASLENMTPLPRYRALNRATSALRGSAYELHIKGLDEIKLRHASVMLEACNTSFQVHFQVSPEEFARFYNIAQVAAGPVLAAATNSPLLFGRQLWRETRIALFQQSVDTRSPHEDLRQGTPRVTFGKDWVRESVVELYQEDIARFRALMAADVSEDSLEVARSGGIPEMRALRTHSGTVYRWNRACYGVLNGKPHLRIENRILPSGPTVLDEVANAAFWFGIISGLAESCPDVTRRMEFSDAKLNFLAAARLGLAAEFRWFGGRSLSASRLIREELLPLATEGLRCCGTDEAAIERYLGVIQARVSSGRSGSQWIVDSLAEMSMEGSLNRRLHALTRGMIRRRREGHPVHEWRPARLEEAGNWKHSFLRVEQYMTTDLFTVREEDSLELVASLMEWERIRHVPVEDEEHRLRGLVSYRTLLRILARSDLRSRSEIVVSEIMTREPVQVHPEATTFEAIQLMREHRIGCLPVVREGRLVGIITERDFMKVSADLFEQVLRE